LAEDVCTFILLDVLREICHEGGEYFMKTITHSNPNRRASWRRWRTGGYLVALLAALWLANYARLSTAKLDAAPVDAPVSNQLQAHEAHPSQPAHSPGEHIHVAQETGSNQFQAVLVSSELVVGMNRFAIGLLDAQGAMIDDAAVHFHYFELDAANAAQVESEADAYPVHTPDGHATIYAQERSFDHAGQWGVEIHVLRSDQSTARLRIRFEVLPDSSVLAVGASAPRVHTPTLVDKGGDLSRLSSASATNPAFYQLGLDQALDNGKPTVLLFATPAFCQTRFCGPDYEIISGLQSRYGEKINFIHVEVYTGLPNPAANDWEIAPAMVAFGLATEPWLYLLDQGGKVAYRVEGMFSAGEIERHLQRVLPGL
jgi:hypothetical protein